MNQHRESELVPAQPPSHHSHLPQRTFKRIGDAGDQPTSGPRCE
jgi:hypothetical protein